MIQYDKDGVTLYYTDASGTKISASVFDGKKHTDMDTVMQQQLAAAAENAHAVDLYTQRLAIAQTSISAGRPAEAPTKPLQHVVSDTGEATFVAFSPALPELVIPKVSAPSSGSIKVETVDTQAIMYAMITAIYRKMFPSA